jgi:predicted transcriptional regulator of viral defense system
MENDFILTLYSRPETVFTVHEVSQYMPGVASKRLRDRLYHAVKIGKLKRMRQGVYAKETYNPMELATKIYTPSYISLETVLVPSGVVFQHYETIFVVSYVTRTITVDKVSIQLRKLHDPILTNTTGMEKKTGYYIATRERAFLDAIYIYKNYHFDNMGGIDWEKVKEYTPMYASAAFNKRVNAYYIDYKNNHGNH